MCPSYYIINIPTTPATITAKIPPCVRVAAPVNVAMGSATLVLLHAPHEAEALAATVEADAVAEPDHEPHEAPEPVADVPSGTAQVA